MILAIYTHKHGADYYLLRDDEEVQRLRKEIPESYWAEVSTNAWTGSPEQVDHYWEYMSERALEWFETTSLTYHYEKP